MRRLRVVMLRMLVPFAAVLLIFSSISIYTLPALAAPLNDNFEDATVILSVPFHQEVSSEDMTTELGELGSVCAGTVGSVWWVFQPSMTEEYVIDTLGSTADADNTVLSVYRNPLGGVENLEELGCNDDAYDGSTTASQITLTLYDNETYYIRVALYDEDEDVPVGTIHLNVNFTPPAIAENDNLAGAITVGTLPFNDIADTTGMGIEPGESTSVCGVETAGSLWWEFTPPESAIYQIDTFGTSDPINDTVLSIYTDDGGGHPLEEVACNDDAGGAYLSLISVSLEESETYYIRVALLHSIAGILSGEVMLNVDFTLGSFLNDNIADAFEVTTLPFTGTSFLLGSTIETNEATETDCQPDTIGSIWWVFSPDETGTYTIDTIGSTLSSGDTVVSVYAYDMSHPLNEIGCDDDIDGGSNNFLSRLVISLQDGKTYLIRVAEFGIEASNSAGTVKLNVTALDFAPPNDNLEDAILVTSLPFNDAVNLGGSTIELNEQESNLGDCGDEWHGSVWWSFSPPATGMYRVDTFGSDPANDTILGIFTDGPVPGTHPLQPFACNDDASPDYTSSIVRTFTAGKTYYIRVSSYYQVEPGMVHLNVTDLNAPPQNDNLANAIVVSPTMPYSGAFVTNSMTEEVDEEDPSCAPTEGSLWWRFTPSVSGAYGIDTFDTNPSSPAQNTVISVYIESSPGSGATYPLIEIGCNNDVLPFLGFSALSVTMTAGTEYFIRVADFDDNPSSTPSGLHVGEIYLYIDFLGIPPTPPPNDDFANAINITLPPDYHFEDYVGGATLQPGEALASCGKTFTYGFPAELGSVWWTFTPAETGFYQIDTYDSWFLDNDTIVSVYTGSAVNALTQIACNDDNNLFGGDLNAMVIPKLTAGTTYYIRVGIYDCGCGFVDGDIALNVMPLIGTAVTISAHSSTELTEGSSVNITVTRDGDTATDLLVEMEIDFGFDFNSTASDFSISNAVINESTISITIPANSPYATFTFNAINEPEKFAEPDNHFNIRLINDPDFYDYFVSSPSSVNLTIMRNNTGVSFGEEYDDNGSVEGSLRQAIANNEIFDSNSTIVLPSDTDFALESPLVIRKSVVIAGDTTQLFYPCGCIDSEVISITGGTVHLYGFTITGGTKGGIAVTGGSVRLGNDPLIITGNSSNTCGGGLYVGPGGNVTIEANSQITDNFTTDGADGGGICVNGGTLLVQGGTTIAGNEADGNGGGIYQTNNASVTVTGLTNINNNTATAGGGIYQDSGSLSVTDSLIQSNIATSGFGGAIRFSATANNSSSVTNSCIVNNTDVSPSVSYNGGTGVIATGNWWGSPAGPYTYGVSQPNPPNNDDTAGSSGDSVTVINTPEALADFNYSGYLVSAPHTGCMVCDPVSTVGGGGVCSLP